MKKIIYITLILIAGLAVWRIVQGPAPEEEEAIFGVSSVRASSPGVRSISRILDYDAVARSRNEAYVFPDVPGIVSRLIKKPGEAVKKDEAILLIDRSQLGLEYAPAEVRAPISGKVLDITVDPGSRIFPQQHVAIVGDTSSMELKFEVPASEARLIKVGQKALITSSAMPGVEIKGQVSRVSASLNPVTRKVPVRVTASNPRSDILPGMVCLVDVTVETLELLSVPVSALLLRDGERGVFLISDEDTAEWKPVEVIIEGREYTGIKGLNESQRVAYDGNYGLIPGGRVEVE